MNLPEPDHCTGANAKYLLRFPELPKEADQDAELCEIHLDGAWQRLRLHDYATIFSLPGLYEQLFYDVLQCSSPKEVVSLLASVMRRRHLTATQMSAIDVGAGNGMVAEELHRLGISHIAGIDILPEAADATKRDRPQIYDDYVVADLNALAPTERARLLAFQPNILTTVAALGFGDIPTQAFANAFNLLATPALLAFNIRDAFLDKNDASGFAKLIRVMTDEGYILQEASKRYVHRLSVRGKPIEYVAVVARKLKDLPNPLPLEFLGKPRKANRPHVSGRTSFAPSALQLCHVSKQYGAHTAVDDVSVDVAEGEFLVLVGGSGSGKTTTLKMINRLVDPSDGQILVSGRNVQDTDPVQLRREIGYAFQGIGLFPHMTVGDNVAAVPRLLGWSRHRIAERVDELLNMVGLDPESFRLRRPAELSGGQQQRVGFARALAARPQLMLLDEPFGALDPLTRLALQREYLRLHRTLKLTTVMVTHDMVEAILFADRIAVMNEGRLLCVGTPSQLLSNPSDGYVASLLDAPREQAERVRSLIEERNESER